MSISERLIAEPNLWLAITRADGRPHLTPIWFVWVDDAAWICTSAKSVKTHVLSRDPRAVFSLESGNNPVVAEALAARYGRPYPPAVRAAFIAKFDWDIDIDDEDGEFDALFSLVVTRWVYGAPDEPGRR